MAKKEKLDYNAEVRRLKESGPERLYLLYGEEDYLLDNFLRQIRALCLEGAEEGFNYRKLDGETMSMSDFTEAVEAVPFFSERTLTEVRGFDFNHMKDADSEYMKKLVADIPEWCTVVFVQGPGSEPDGRLGITKAVKKSGRAIEFTAQDETAIIRWIAKRFASLGKSISRADAEYLVFSAGTLMNRLIPEIEKLGTGVEGDTVTRHDIDAMVQRIPEADVFEMVDMLGLGRYDAAAGRLSDLLAAQEEPIKLLALIGMQMRRVFAVKIAQSKRLGKNDTMELAGVKYDFQLKKLSESAGKYTTAQLKNLVTLCAEYDYKMKSSGGDSRVLLTELFALMAAGAKC